MIDLNIISHKVEFVIYIDHFKYLYIKDYNIKRGIINCLDGFFCKEKDSEFAIETKMTNKIFSDGKLINVNDFDYFKITENFDIKNELKLGTKTLFSRYLELKLEKIEYTENFQTLEYLLEDLNNILKERIVEDISVLNLRINIELEKKQLLKLITLNIMKEELISNFLDISYYEIIELQLEMLLAITKEVSKKTIIAIDTPYIKESWLQFIKLFPKNVYILLFPNALQYAQPKDVFILKDNIQIDLFDDNSLYELCMNENTNYTIEEYRNILMQQLI